MSNNEANGTTSHMEETENFETTVETIETTVETIEDKELAATETIEDKESATKETIEDKESATTETVENKESAVMLEDLPSTSSTSLASVAEGSILQLKIVLRYISPIIWRRIQVRNTDTFHDLHTYIQEAMGWGWSHSHQFIAMNKTNDDDQVFIVPSYMMCNADFYDSDVKLSEYLSAANDAVLYEYDLGDSWLHDIIVEKVLPPAAPKAKYPKCLGGKRACPPDDCGGVPGYEHLLEVLKNPSHEEYQELITEWLEDLHPGFDPEKFDKKKVFKRETIWVKA